MYNTGSICTELPLRLRNLENTGPVIGIQEENGCIEDIPGLSLDPDDLDDLRRFFKGGNTEGLQKNIYKPPSKTPNDK